MRSDVPSPIASVSTRCRNELAYVLGIIEGAGGRTYVGPSQLVLIHRRIAALGVPADYDPSVEPDYPSFQARDAGRPERQAKWYLAQIDTFITRPRSDSFAGIISEARRFVGID